MSMALVEDVIREIFLRLPPGRALLCAAAGCRSWRDMLSEAAFTRDYLRRHGERHMLGFLHVDVHTDGDDGEQNWVSHFVSTGSFESPAYEERLDWRVLDSRHGLVLFLTPTRDMDFVVCDLVTGQEWEIYASPECEDIMWWEGFDAVDSPEDEYTGIHCNAVVLCANDPCNHHLFEFHHGGSGHFRVALVGHAQDYAVAHATVYSSDTGEWSNMISHPNPEYINGRGHSAVVGNKVYVPCFETDSVETASVVEYNIGEQQLSVIDCPLDENQPYIHLLGVDDGMLLFASVVMPRLFLWSMEVGPNVAAGWARRRVIDLQPLLPQDVLSNMSDVFVDVLPVGFAEGARVIFLTTRNGLYTVDLNSGNAQMVHLDSRIERIKPYMRFYTGA